MASISSLRCQAAGQQRPVEVLWCSRDGEDWVAIHMLSAGDSVVVVVVEEVVGRVGLW